MKIAHFLRNLGRVEGGRYFRESWRRRMIRRRTVELAVLLVAVAALQARESSLGARGAVYCVPTRATVAWNNLSLPASSEFTTVSLRTSHEERRTAGTRVGPGDP